MKICLITKRYYTAKDLFKDRYGRMYHLPKSWNELGAQVVVLALDYCGNEELFRQEGGLTLRSVPSRIWGGSGLSSALSLDRPDVVIASGHLNIAAMGLNYARRMGVPFLMDVYDFYPAFHRPIRYPLELYLRWVLHHADGAMVVSSALKEWCSRMSLKVKRIPNGVDRSVFVPRSDACEGSAVSGEKGGLRLGLFGSLSVDLGEIEVMAAFKEFRQLYPGAEMIVAGCGGSRLSTVPGVRHLGMLSQHELVDWASSCDCLLVPYRNSLQVKFSQSARLAEYLSLRRPIVATRVGDALNWLPTEFSGFCEPEDSNSMLGAILRQCETPEIVEFPESLNWGDLGEASYRFIRQFAAPAE